VQSEALVHATDVRNASDLSSAGITTLSGADQLVPFHRTATPSMLPPPTATQFDGEVHDTPVRL
jgi:hypothetical protein